MTEPRPNPTVATEQKNGTHPGAPAGRSRRRSPVWIAAAAVGALLIGSAAGLQAPGVRVALAELRAEPVVLPDPTPTPAPTPTPTAAAEAPAKQAKAPATSSRKTITIPRHGSGGYTTADVNAAARSHRGRLITFSVRVEKGMPFGADATARFIAATLNDRRSWDGTGRWRFQLVDDPADAELHAWIVSPTTTDQKCAPLLTRGQVSCQSGHDVVLNATRWGLGAKAFGSDLTGYRRYLVNHEFGHYLGYGHVGCPGKGKPAPVMMQQTKGVGKCRPNPWPAEDPD